jgi:hypothetical protein
VSGAGARKQHIHKKIIHLVSWILPQWLVAALCFRIGGDFPEK